MAGICEGTRFGRTIHVTGNKIGANYSWQATNRCQDDAERNGKLKTSRSCVCARAHVCVFAYTHMYCAHTHPTQARKELKQCPCLPLPRAAASWGPWLTALTAVSLSREPPASPGLSRTWACWDSFIPNKMPQTSIPEGSESSQGFLLNAAVNFYFGTWKQ